MKEHAVRASFHQKILKSAHCEEDALIVNELGLRNGESRADIAVLNGKMVGYEIKTESDTLTRLSTQVIAYNEVFDKIYIVTGRKHLNNVLEAVPQWWGIYVIKPSTKDSNSFTFELIRRAKVNKNKSSFAIAQLLWKDEVLAILNQDLNCNIKGKFDKHELYNLLSSKCAPKELSKIASSYLKSRTSWRTDPKLPS